MMHTSQCSVECGSGIRLKTSVVCRDKVTGDDEIENVCENELITEEIPCHKDPCKASFGPWNEWTLCSKTCLKNPNETSFKSRTRTCFSNDQAVCSIGSLETRSCEAVPLCPLKGNQFPNTYHSFLKMTKTVPLI